nr:DUF1289 domain-containing protein [Oceanobacter mangrovi]
MTVLDQGELFEIPNPCVGICTSNNKGYCKGCLRSRQERFHWNDFTPNQRQLVINLCEKRRQKILAARVPKPAEEVVPENSPQTDLFAEMPTGVTTAGTTEQTIAVIPTEAVPDQQSAPASQPAVPATIDVNTERASTQPPSPTTGDQLGLF